MVAANLTRRSHPSLFRLLMPMKSTRTYRPVEIYQKLYGPKLKDAVIERGYHELTEEAAHTTADVAEASGRAHVRVSC
jgi:hypothetical protein